MRRALFGPMPGQLLERRDEAVERREGRHSAALGPAGAVVALHVGDLAAEEIHHLLDALVGRDLVLQVLLLERPGSAAAAAAVRSPPGRARRSRRRPARRGPRTASAASSRTFAIAGSREALLDDRRSAGRGRSRTTLPSSGSDASSRTAPSCECFFSTAARNAPAGSGVVERLGDDLERRQADEAGDRRKRKRNFLLRRATGAAADACFGGAGQSPEFS